MIQIDPHHLDAPETSSEHARIIKSKPLLKSFYDESYRFLSSSLPKELNGIDLELGSGGGYLKELLPEVLTSDIVELPEIDLAVDAEKLPFENDTLRSILLVNVFHHIPDVESFLAEALRCLQVHGRIIMVEPANTYFARFIYRHFHHEPFLPNAKKWQFRSEGRLTSANGALPWIVFRRDLSIFYEKFPQFELKQYSNFSPIGYLLSGGLSHAQFVPKGCTEIVLNVEKIMAPLYPLAGLFTKICVEKRA